MTDQLHPLKSRAILRLSGPERVSFLNGLITQDVTALSPERGLYGAMLTPQGKYLADFLMIDTGDAILLDVDRDQLAGLERRLTMYKLRSAVEIADESDAWAILADTTATTGNAGDCKAGGGDNDPAYHLTDPRLAALGQRQYWPVDRAPAATGSEEAWHAHRLACGVPHLPTEAQAEKTLILEADIDLLNGVSFAKGCYVGQELTARMKYRGKIRKRLLPIQIDGALPAAGTAVEKDGKTVGEVRGGADSTVMAELRLEVLEDPEGLSIGGIPAKLALPDWFTNAVS